MLLLETKNHIFVPYWVLIAQYLFSALYFGGISFLSDCLCCYIYLIKQILRTFLDHDAWFLNFLLVKTSIYQGYCNLVLFYEGGK